MSEFDWIAKYFSPLSASEGLGLRDDAALMAVESGKELVITNDAIVAGVHFFVDDAPRSIARKALRVNLSDLAAKGAAPRGYLMSLMLPPTINEEWLEEFCAGLQEDQNKFGIQLYGGDTSRIDGPLAISITAIGEVTAGSMLRRSGAQMGDFLYMTGGLGNAALGLKVRRGELRHNEYLLERYLHPIPKLDLGQRLAGIATAAMDISDGLVQDAGHLARASDCALVINTKQLTFSREARDVLNQSPDLFELMLTGGDDYELLFTSPPEMHEELIALSEQTEVTISQIGLVEAGEGVAVIDDEGQIMSFTQQGYRHF